jgi:hypothetical protein
VGTASPATALDLQTSGTGNIELTLKNNNASPGSGRILFADTAASDAGVIQYEHGGGADAMVFKTATNEAMRITSGANVGIGTSSPSTKIHLNESGSANVVQRIQAGTNGYAAQLQLYGNNVSGAAFNSVASYVNGDGTPQWEITGPEASAEDQMLLHTGGSERMRIDSSGRVGIGTSSPGANLEIKSSGLAELRIDGGAVSSSVGPLIRGQHNNTDAFYIGTNSVVLGETPNQDVIIYGADSSSGNIRFYAGASTETARIRSGGGITFNGDTAAVNALDDYEEGTWTPSVRGSTTNGSFSGSNTVGFYTKIGDTVHAWFDCDGTISGAAGIIVFTGLPYASISTVEAVGQFMFSDLNVDGTRTNFVLYLGGNSTEMEIFQSKDDVSWTQVSISNESIGIRGQITYKTA